MHYTCIACNYTTFTSECKIAQLKVVIEVKLSKEITIDTSLMRRYNARRYWTMLRNVMTLVKLYKPSQTEGVEKKDIEFETLIMKHIKKNRLKKCFNRKRSLK